MFCCDLCPYTTKFAAWMRKHNAVHSKDHRPFLCDVCGSSFKLRSHLNYHKQTHEAPSMGCGLCEFKCRQKWILDVHMRIHRDERPFKGELCEYRTKRQADIAIHHRCMHGKYAPRKKKREEDVAVLFDTLSIRYVREFSISFSGCARKYARLDFLMEVPFGWVILEVDERQHSQYAVSYECQRMALIFAEFSKRCNGNLHIIRYNPDAYKEHGLVVKPTQEERAEEIRRAIEHVPEARFTITYLFYRLTNGWPEIASHADYTLQTSTRCAGP